MHSRVTYYKKTASDSGLFQITLFIKIMREAFQKSNTLDKMFCKTPYVQMEYRNFFSIVLFNTGKRIVIIIVTGEFTGFSISISDVFYICFKIVPV